MKIVFASVQFATPYTPQRHFLGMGYLHAYAKLDPFIGPRTEMVHNYYDPSIRTPAQIAAAICEEAPDLVGFSCYVWNTPDILRISKALKAMRPETKVILGGPEVSYHHLRILNHHPYVDWIVVNEGEETFREFLCALLENREKDFGGIQGLAIRKNGESVTPAPRGYRKVLDELPSPYLEGVLDVCDVRGGANYQTARGCPFVCTFCDYGRNQPYFEFSIERVRAEFEFFKQRNARILFNVDPTFNYSRKRAEAILDLGIEFDIKAIHWFEVFPSLVNEDLVALVHKSYCSFIGCGIQTCNPTTMKNIRRVWKPDKVAPLLDQLSKKKNVIMSYEIIMGLPGDSVQDYKDTMSWTYERHPADIKAFNLAILPRTPLEKQVKDGRWNVSYDEDVGHEVLATDAMDREEVMVGKAINDWHRILQNNFFRLRHVIPQPAGDLIEAWAWRVYHAGMHDRIPDLQVHRIDPELIEGLADEWERFVAELCKQEGVPDVSRYFRDMLRYHFYRRARTWASTFFADVRDIYFNEPYEGLHQFYAAREQDLRSVAEDAELGTEVPKLGGDIGIALFEHDMDDLFLVHEAAALLAVEPKETEYVFFMRPDTGAGCGILVDKVSHRFVELVDGKRSVAEIQNALVAGLGAEAAARAPAVYRALRDCGLFSKPTFLTEFEDGKISWQSCFPEHYRAYH